MEDIKTAQQITLIIIILTYTRRVQMRTVMCGLFSQPFGGTCCLHLSEDKDSILIRNFGKHQQECMLS
jgi:hypothetical protein